MLQVLGIFGAPAHRWGLILKKNFKCDDLTPRGFNQSLFIKFVWYDNLPYSGGKIVTPKIKNIIYTNVCKLKCF